jgi:hypothetical protein
MLLAGNLASFCQRAVNDISCSGEADVGASLLKSYQIIKQRAGRYSNRRVALGSEVQGMTRLLVVEDARRRRTRSVRQRFCQWLLTLMGDYASMSSGRARARGAAEGRHRTYDAIVLDRMLPGGNAVVRDGSSFAGLF